MGRHLLRMRPRVPGATGGCYSGTETQAVERTSAMSGNCGECGAWMIKLMDGICPLCLLRRYDEKFHKQPYKRVRRCSVHGGEPLCEHWEPQSLHCLYYDDLPQMSCKFQEFYLVPVDTEDER